MVKKRMGIILLVTAFLIITVLSGCSSKSANGGKVDPSVQPSTNEQTTAPSTTAPTAAPTATATPEVKKEEPVELTLVADASAFSEPIFKALFDGFEKAYPNVKLKTEVGKEINKKLAEYVAAGTPPDLYYGGFPNTAELREQGKLMDFNDFFDSKAYDFEGTVRESLVTGSEDAALVEGKRWGVPVGPGFTGIVVNDKLFKDNGWKVPTNWDELVAVSAQIKAKGITPIAYGALGDENRLETGSMVEFLYQNGGDQLGLDLDNLVPGVWASQPVIDSFKMVKELSNKGIIDKKGLGMDPPQSQVAFLQGKYAMVFSGFWFELEMKDQMKGMELGYIAFPANKAGIAKQSVNAWFSSFGAWNTTDPKKKEAVWDFMRYMVSYEFQKKLAIEGGLTVVSNRRVMEEMSSDPNTSYFTKAVAKTMADPNVKEITNNYQFWYFDTMRKPMLGALSSVVSGKITPEQAAQLMEKAAEKTRNDSTIIKQKH